MASQSKDAPNGSRSSDFRPAGVFEPDLVYDVGAHLGEDAEFYLALGYRVVAIEANPQHAAHLRQRFSSEIRSGRLCVIAKAIARKSGHVPFYLNEAVSVWGTADSAWAARNAEVGADSVEIQVEALPFSEVVEQHGIPFYAKIDIEGADRLCLEGLTQFTGRPAFVSVEAPTDNWADLLAQFDQLAELGYSRFQVVRQGQHRTGEFVTQSGTSLVHSFDVHSSGPFGQFLPKAWLTREQALRRYRVVWLAERLLNDRTRLGRTLARLPLLRRIPAALGWHDTHATL